MHYYILVYLTSANDDFNVLLTNNRWTPLRNLPNLTESIYMAGSWPTILDHLNENHAQITKTAPDKAHFYIKKLVISEEYRAIAMEPRFVILNPRDF